MIGYKLKRTLRSPSSACADDDHYDDALLAISSPDISVS